jgi:hypothetical protein
MLLIEKQLLKNSREYIVRNLEGIIEEIDHRKSLKDKI